MTKCAKSTAILHCFPLLHPFKTLFIRKISMLLWGLCFKVKHRILWLDTLFIQVNVYSNCLWYFQISCGLEFLIGDSSYFPNSDAIQSAKTILYALFTVASALLLFATIFVSFLLRFVLYFTEMESKFCVGTLNVELYANRVTYKLNKPKIGPAYLGEVFFRRRDEN